MMKKKLPHARSSAPQNREMQTGFLLLLLSFMVGSLAGSFIGSFFNFADILNDSLGVSPLGTMDFIKLFIHFVRFHLAVILLGSSFLGIVLLPVLSCIRGYALSCTAVSIISSYHEHGLIMALVVLGIPALFSIPCFFIMSVDGFMSSKRIYGLSRGILAKRTDKFLIRAILCLPFLAAGVVVEMKLVPYLVSLLT